LYFIFIKQKQIIDIMKLILLVLSVMALSCNSPSETTATQNNSTVEQAVTSSSSYSVLNVADFKAKMESLTGQGFNLVDVRTPEEVASGTIENSINIDFNNSNFSEGLAKLDKSKPLMLFCRSGARSGRASSIAKELGFTEIYDLQGGFMAWSAQ
jgi:rhodanese-related sulfurtransferase